jgi:hypothetical protein
MKAALIVLFALVLGGAAAASPCGDRIAQLQSRYDAHPIIAGSGPVGAAPSAAESETATLHHQPAPATDADATAPAMSPASIRDARFRNEMEMARAAEHSGDAAGCEAATTQAERALNP